METAVNIKACDTGLKQWLEQMTGGILAIQPGNNADLKTEHFLFQLINVSDPANIISEIKEENGVTYNCITSDVILTYQVDLLYCQYGIDKINNIVGQFHSGVYRRFGSYSNLAFLRAGGLVRQPEWINTRRHFRTTVDLDFAYRKIQCLEINTIETFSIIPCDDIPDFPEETFSR